MCLYYYIDKEELWKNNHYSVELKQKVVKDMSKDEYIAHLELENQILKRLGEMLENRKMPSEFRLSA